MYNTTLSTSVDLLRDVHKDRNALAWSEFLRRYTPMLLAFARRRGLDDDAAQEVASDTLVAVLTDFRKRSEPFDRSAWPFRAWLKGVAMNKLKAWWKKRANQQNEMDAAIRIVQSDDDRLVDRQAEREIDEEEDRVCLQRALQRVAVVLGPKYAQVLEARIVQELTSKETARLLGTNPNAVDIMKCKALKCLRQEYKKILEEEEVHITHDMQRALQA